MFLNINLKKLKLFILYNIIIIEILEKINLY